MDTRPYRPHDRGTLLALSGRLTEGVASWRDHSKVRQAVEGWVRDSLDRSDDDGHVLVAVDTGQVIGFVTVGEHRHWSGDTDAYIGELVVADHAEGRGIGRALVAEAERWAVARGHQRITLETGAANETARRFYAALGYVEEQVQLTRELAPPTRR